MPYVTLHNWISILGRNCVRCGRVISACRSTGKMEATHRMQGPGVPGVEKKIRLEIHFTITNAKFPSDIVPAKNSTHIYLTAPV